MLLDGLFCNRLSGGPWAWKKLSKQSMDKFKNDKIAYAQGYIQFLYGMDPAKVKFFDEAGVNGATGHRSCQNLKIAILLFMTML